MLDFACKQFVIDDIIKCSLGLTKAELKVFKYLATHNEDMYTTDSLAKKVLLDLSTVQRAVKKLHDQNVVLRHQENLTGGGYVFSYQIVKHKFLEHTLMTTLSHWLERVKKELKQWP